MRSLMVPVSRKSGAGAAGLALAVAAVCGDVHAAATMSAPPATHNHENVFEFMQDPTQTHHARTRQNAGIEERKAEATLKESPHQRRWGEPITLDFARGDPELVERSG